MGCCGSKSSDKPFEPIVTTEQAGKGIAAAGTVTAGAAIGAAITGPAAPIGALVGAAVGAAIAKSTAGTVGKVVVAPIGLLQDVWRGLLNRPEILDQLPDIGMLRSERKVYPPSMSELTETNSYLYQIHPATVGGLKFEDALEGKLLSDAQRTALADAIKVLEAKKCKAITGDCSAMLHYQEEVLAMTKLPVLLSALLQARTSSL